MTKTMKETTNQTGEGQMITKSPALEESITFNCPADNPIIKLSKEGFFFNGELIEDAGEAHGAFLEVMGLVKKEQQDNE